ncbi:MAG: hypothetical protein ACI31M_03020 [Bacilli bacterium]
MNEKYENIIINYPKNLKSTVNKIKKELNRFIEKYKKILVLNSQKEIEVNIIECENIDIRVTNRLINVLITNKINIREISIMIELKILDILSKDKVYIPDYVKEQVEQSFNLKSKIESNNAASEKIVAELNKM